MMRGGGGAGGALHSTLRELISADLTLPGRGAVQLTVTQRHGAPVLHRRHIRDREPAVVGWRVEPLAALRVGVLRPGPGELLALGPGHPGQYGLGGVAHPVGDRPRGGGFGHVARLVPAVVECWSVKLAP